MPSGNISLDYTEIERVSTEMNKAVDNINPMLTNTKTTVEGLLDNGMFMQQSSPALKESYNQLTLSLTKAIESITVFATQLNTIKENIQKMDEQIAASTKKG